MVSNYSPFWLQLLGSFKVFVVFCLLLWLLGWLVGGWVDSWCFCWWLIGECLVVGWAGGWLLVVGWLVVASC